MKLFYKVFLFLIVTLSSNLLFAGEEFTTLTSNESNPNYAYYLLKDKDFLRAAGEFKRLAYYAEDDRTRLEWLLLTARCERWAGQSNFARKYSSHVEIYALEYPGIADEARLEISLNALDRNNLLLASQKLNLIENQNLEIYNKSLSLNAGIRLWQRDFTAFDKQVNALDSKASNYQTLFSSLNTIKKKTQHEKLKSPFMASLLSGLIPGSGQMYAQHPVDGIQAFMMTGLFAFVSYVAWNHDMDKYDNPSGMFAVSASFTALIHSANILGANKTAKYRNARIRQDALDAVIKEVDELIKEDTVKRR